MNNGAVTAMTRLRRTLRLLGILVATAFLLVPGCQSDLPQMDPEAHRLEIREWHSRRIEGLLQPDGWLSVVGLEWLVPGENTFGSDSSNAVVFPAIPGIPGRIGSFFLEGEIVRMEVQPGFPVTHLGEPVTSLTLFSPEIRRPPSPRLGSLRWQAIQRQDLIGIRLRDTANAAIQGFTGIETFPVSIDWRIPARFDRYDPPKIIEIPNILGQVIEQPSPGAVIFRIAGARFRLEVTGDPDSPSFSVVFGDETNGIETYGGGRFLEVGAPDGRGRTFIDFNKAYNPPCVFTAFATCPLPTRENRLPVRIEAGEMGHH
jgi:uncharacterized protein (DUF1684 family)